MNHSLRIPFDSFSFLDSIFFEKFLPKSLHVSILFHTFAIATIIVRSTPHKQRVRIYVQARPTFLLRLWAYFFARTFPHRARGEALCLCGALRIVWRCKLKYTAVRLPRVFIALCGGKHYCCSRRGSASRFFRTPTSTVPDGFGHKATTIVYYANNCINSAHSSFAPVDH